MTDWERKKSGGMKEKGRYSLPTNVAFCDKGLFNATLFPSQTRSSPIISLIGWCIMVVQKQRKGN